MAPDQAKPAPFRDQFHRVLGVIRRGKLLILACVLLVVAPTIVFLQQATPRYTANAAVLIEAPDATDSLLDRSDMSRTRLNDLMITTEAEVLGSTPLARRVIDKLGLDQDPEFNARLRKPTAFQRVTFWLNPINWIPDGWRAGRKDEATMTPKVREELQRARVTATFLGRLSVKPKRRSFVIDLEFTATSREKSALIVNTLADLYVFDRLEAGFDETKRVNEWLAQRLESLRGDVALAEAAVETYRAENGLRPVGERQGTVANQQLTELNSRLVLARADLAQKQARLDQVRSLSRGGGVATASDVLQSSLIQQLRQREAEVRSALSEAEKTYGERHPKIIGMRADLGQLQSSIGGEIGKIASSAEGDVEIAAIGVRTLEREIVGLRQEGDVQGGAIVRLRELERQADSSRSLYEAFLSRFKRNAEQEQIQRANARLLSPADIPASPSYPRKIPILLVMMVVGFGLGIGLVFLVEGLDGTVHSTEELEALVGLPPLAVIPVVRGRGGGAVVLARPRAPIAHAFRNLRTALTLNGEETRRRIVMVSSSVPKEGKSFVSLGLALTYARAGERVLLIDADVHRSSLAATIGIDGTRGLAQVLRGEATLDQVVTRPPGMDLDFLAAGEASAQEELFDASTLGALLSEPASRYDRIIIDTAPVLAVADARIVAGVADQVIYLVRWGSTQQTAVRNGIKLLRDVRAPLAGMVLSQVDVRRHAVYGYGDYGASYGRYQEYYAE
ncbi:GumC family protein [Rhodospirillum rubrum]|uniref:non-specific protein-tyrosine kinase n=1 Tax=Rhodospirillum rubrum (strain ATCC 11170 / ATH 1.1.1 / DSM 467 / LMG 4362 / NCIMB 8255 / S1) TaxID=269796 RepID=Q2RUA4_RHORT|nr:polysaccharide biosynthesis tyrosine autokinase [Rhodospirillum rubrum]ABC22291.1 Protein-tyrosine kinase [Rhodospirillum rubrum ATCC 11170]AEO48009.1 protein-tyrosine kinase [Rhodospirillum rubrum F11]MBK5953859.1 protein tyrosine kinase [Rhodospirillum rubrum]QXG81932.1 polysaccharide biosynthesis tyrosine autokinase [Rhodospirillum rubrum]HAP98812.1 protein tyrosine kinase [Rhodospirillum rubrum]